MTTKICSLGHSIGALQQLARALTPEMKRKLFKTTADIAYVDTGLAGAVQQLQWLAVNEVAIRAALAALDEARKGPRTKSRREAELTKRAAKMPRVCRYPYVPGDTIVRGEWYVSRDCPVDKNGCANEYLHIDGKWRRSTFISGEPTGYYATEDDAKAALAKARGEVTG